MRKQTLILCVLSFSAIHAQTLDYFVPAGFNNPFLKSGQFIAGLFYDQSRTTMSFENEESANSSKRWQFIGYLGLIDGLTLRADLSLYPKQTVYEITSGGAGETENTSYLRPNIALSYRPTKALEIYGDLTYSGYTRQQGPISRYQDVPVGVNPDGSYIYERQLVTQPALPDMDLKGTTVKLGISYYGNLW